MIVAFLQNMWLKDPERFKKKLARAEAEYPGSGEVFRMRMIEYALFAGCLTGRRLEAAFGDLIDDIIWEETTREIADNPKTIFPAQPDHIEEVLRKHQPKVVIAFGGIAAKAVAPLWNGILIRTCHPAARQPDTVAKLKAAAECLKQAIIPLEL